jgi:hypothetical protein
MKVVFLPGLLLLLSLATTAYSQQALGTIKYFEGITEAKSESQTWIPVRLEQHLIASDSIRTAGRSRLEIAWTSGQTTILMGGEVHEINALFQSLDIGGNSQRENVFSRFQELFRATSQNERLTEGGIRRDEVEAQQRVDPTALFWFMEEPADIQSAHQLYEENNFRDALPIFIQFTEQQFASEEVERVYFMIAHCFFELNNYVKGIETLELMLRRFPGGAYSVLGYELLETVK